MSSKNKPGLWANIHAKRERIAKGSGERMRRPGEEGAPTAKALEESKTASVAYRAGAIAARAYLGLNKTAGVIGSALSNAGVGAIFGGMAAEEGQGWEGARRGALGGALVGMGGHGFNLSKPATRVLAGAAGVGGGLSTSYAPQRGVALPPQPVRPYI
jgi:hypothetical protein